MKRILSKPVLILFFLSFFFNSQAQGLVKEVFYSQAAKDSIHLKIWLPQDYDSEQSYPVIYEFVYDHTDYIAATLNHLYECPSTIVVHADFYPETSYEKPSLSPKGELYYQFVKEELLPYIEQKYKTLHRTATGLSQGADYVNYILRTNPELFDAYLIFAIEAPYYEADFTRYTDKIKMEKDYFIAVANDTERRVAFANDLHEYLKGEKSINLLKREYKTAPHSYAMLYGLADGLLFIYDDYVSYRKKAVEETFSQYFTNIIKETTAKYGKVQYNGLLIQLFSQLTPESSKIEIETILAQLYADKDNITDLDLFNLGYLLYENLKFYDLAAQTFRASIERGKELPKTERKMVLKDTYSWLGRVYYKQKDYDNIYNVLQEGYEETQAKYLLMRYALYSFNLGNNAQIKKGIAALDELVLLPKSEDSFRNPEQAKDLIYLLYAKGFWKLKKKNKSRKYLDLALSINPDNKSALAFQKSIES